MGSMKLVPKAHLYPLRSLRGKTIGPFVDTRVDLDSGPGPCRVYLSRQETWEAAALWGFVMPETLAAVEERAVLAEARVLELEGELDRERASKVVPLKDVRKLIREYTNTNAA